MFTRIQLIVAIRFSCSLAHMKLEHCSLPQEKDRVDSIGGTPQTSSLKIKKCSKSARKPAPKLPFESTFLFSIGQKIGQKLKKKIAIFFWLLTVLKIQEITTIAILRQIPELGTGKRSWTPPFRIQIQ